jgi:hypothetical protein
MRSIFQSGGSGRANNSAVGGPTQLDVDPSDRMQGAGFRRSLPRRYLSAPRFHARSVRARLQTPRTPSKFRGSLPTIWFCYRRQSSVGAGEVDIRECRSSSLRCANMSAARIQVVTVPSAKAKLSRSPGRFHPGLAISLRRLRTIGGPRMLSRYKCRQGKPGLRAAWPDRPERPRPEDCWIGAKPMIGQGDEGDRTFHRHSRPGEIETVKTAFRVV